MVKLEYMNLQGLKKANRNPKLHALEDIMASIVEHGFWEFPLINEATGRLVVGHGRLEGLEALKGGGTPPPENIQVGPDGSWLVPVIRGKSFKSEAAAESYLLTANKLVEKGGWDRGLLEKMLQEVEPIGFDVLKELDKDLDAAIEGLAEIQQEALPTPTKQVGVQGVGTGKVDSTGFHQATTEPTKYRCEFDEIPGNLQGVFSIEEHHVFSSGNQLGIPDLIPDMILPEIPRPIQTWGGDDITPDDGNYFFHVFGSTVSKGVPYERSVVAYFTNDQYVQTLLNTPAYRAGQFLQAGVLGVVVPDVSLWEGNPLVIHMYSIYQAQWMGRFMQEVGIKIIPRFEYFLPEVREFSLLGIPKRPPTLATQLHTGFSDEHIPRIKDSLLSGLKLLEPNQFLVYVSERGAAIIEDVGKDLPVGEIIILPTAKRVRRGSRAETDPYLLELRKRKHGWEGKPKESVEEE